MDTLSTRIVFSTDVTVPSEMTAAGLFYEHGLHNFIYGTGKRLVEQLQEAVAQQVVEQHAAVVADVRRYWELYEELRKMFDSVRGTTFGYARTEQYNGERARSIKEEMEALLVKHGATEEYAEKYFRFI